MNRYVVFAILYALCPVLFALPVLEHDANQYFQYARNIVDTGVYGLRPGLPDQNREPGFGVFLAIITAVCDFLGFRTQEQYVKFMFFGQAALMSFAAFRLSYKSYLPRKMGRILYAAIHLSPTFFVMNSSLFSEGFAASMMLFFLSFALRSLYWESKSNLMSKPALQNALLSGLALGAFVLTKQYSVVLALFLAMGLLFAVVNNRKHKWLVTLGIAGALALAMGGAWKLRNKTSGAPLDISRVAVVIAGKTLRASTITASEIPMAIVGSIGRTTCEKIYGVKPCQKFDYIYPDELGFQAWSDYNTKYGEDVKLAEKMLMRDMFGYWFKEPHKQAFGVFLEVIKIAFFESMVVYTNVGKIFGITSLWHGLGSILSWVLIFSAWINWKKKHELMDPFLGRAFFLATVVVGFHFAVMGQLSNVSRYVLPIVPAFYLLSMGGLWIKLQSKGLLGRR